MIIEKAHVWGKKYMSNSQFRHKMSKLMCTSVLKTKVPRLSPRINYTVDLSLVHSGNSLYTV